MNDAATDRLRDAVAGLDEDSTFVSRYIVVAEVVNTDGTAAVQYISDCDLLYQTLGLLEHGKQLALARFHGWDDDE